MFDRFLLFYILFGVFRILNSVRTEFGPATLFLPSSASTATLRLEPLRRRYPGGSRPGSGALPAPRAPWRICSASRAVSNRAAARCSAPPLHSLPRTPSTAADLARPCASAYPAPLPCPCCRWRDAPPSLCCCSASALPLPPLFLSLFRSPSVSRG